MNIYVGNLPYNTNENEMREAFEAFGAVSSVSIIKDKFTGRSKGFGFVEMGDAAQANAAIESFNGKEWKGRSLKVNEARPREESAPRSGGGGGRSGSGSYSRNHD